jgi:large subunit ribosomal protein L30
MLFAVIRLKGTINVRYDLAKTLDMLRLNRPNHCILMVPTKENVGMLDKVGHMITWGEIDEKTALMLINKRGRITGDQRVTEDYIKSKTGKSLNHVINELVECKIKLADIPGMKLVFRLKPPSKGLGTLGLKKQFSMGGAFGYRGKEINSFLMRMI